jgi:hypothetical protein
MWARVLCLTFFCGCTQDFDVFLGDAATDAIADNATDAPSTDAALDVATDGAVPCTEPNAVMFGGHCYFELTTLQDATTAKTNCTNAGAHLVTITGSAEEAAVAPIDAGSERWIGLFRTAGQPVDANYAWVDGESRAGYADWSPGEPDGSGQCVRLEADGTWGDDPCTNMHPAICERE